MPARAPLGEADCECVHDGWLAQPVNALSSLAYTAAGAALVARARRRRKEEGDGRPGWLGVYGMAIAANGLGGVAYHGPGGPLSRWAHDAALLATLAIMATAEVGEAAGAEVDRRHAAAAAAAGGALAVVPAVSRAAQVGLGMAVAAAEVAAARAGDAGQDRRRVPLLATSAVAVTVHAASRTGGPLCRPEGVVQGHALWHGLTALGLWWWGRFTPSRG
jgi:hypothetical protein